MKRNLLFLSLLASLASCVNTRHAATQQPYETTINGDEKILKGMLSRSVIEKDTSFKWFKANYALGMADTAATAAFKQNAAKFKVIVFGGTWCHDTQSLLPVFYRLTDKAGYPDSSITLVGVDRNKQSINNLSAAFNITNVPTFIIMKEGKEVGRVIEYGKYGQVDKELGEIVSGL